MKKYKWIVILINLILLLLYFNYSVTEKETLLKNGRLVLLELAPKDPRSLMQGDYMALRYKMPDHNFGIDKNKRGYCVVTIDSNDVATITRFQQNISPLNANEHIIKYHSPNLWDINIGAESYFFQEGEAEKYEKAKYGAIKIDAEGNSLLIGLYNEKLKSIQ